MRKILLISPCFLVLLVLQTPVVIHAFDAKDSGTQKSELPRSFLKRTETSFRMDKKGESISLFSNRLTLEQILERIAVEMKVDLKFYCEDPGLRHEGTVNLRVSGDSILKVVEQLLSGGHKFIPVNREGKAIENGKDIERIDIYPNNCAETDSPVRIFAALEPSQLRKPPEEISLEELDDILKRLGPAFRRRAADILGRKGDERGIAYAEKALKDENFDVMLAAAGALRRLGEKYGFNKVASAIYARFRERPYAELLPVIVQVDKDKIWPIAEGLIDQSGEKEKGLMVKALSLTNDTRAVKYLLKISMRSVENAKQAIYAIGKIGGPAAAVALTELISEGHAQRQVFAAQAVHFLPREDGLEARKEVEKIVRRAGVSDGLLNGLVEVRYLEPLEKLLMDPASQPETKVRVLNALETQGDKSTIEVASIGLKDETPRVRLASVEAMGSIAVEEAIPHLLNATRDKDAKVRSAAIKALSQFPGNDSIVEAVVEAIHDMDQNVRRSAVDGLRRLGKPSEKVVAVLKECENDEDPYMVEKADAILRNWHLK